MSVPETLAREKPKYLPDLAVLLERTSDVRIHLGEGREAMAATDQQVKISERLARTDRGNARQMWNLVIALRRRGDLYRRQVRLALDEL